jgi:hypothetical protein
MKPFDSLAEQELVALSEDEIQRYIDYACAENGVPLLPSLPPAPVEVSYTPDAQVFTIGHWLHFRHPEQAARVLEAINEAAPVETSYISTPSHITSTVLTARRSSFSITTTEAFTAEQAESIKSQLAEAKRQEDVYAKAKKAYDSAVSERESYASEIREKVGAAWEMHHARESRRRDYDRYLQLADGNAQIAARFLVNAHRDARTLLPELFAFEGAEALPSRPEPTPEAVGVGDIPF